MNKIVALIAICLLLITLTPVGAELNGLQEANIPVVIQVQKGDPTYTVVIPEPFNLDKVKQGTGIYTHSFNIEVNNVNYLDNQNIYAFISPNFEEDFVFRVKGEIDTVLPYKVVNKTHGTDTDVIKNSVENLYFAKFSDNAIAECDLIIDTSIINTVDTYEGTIDFLFYLAE